MQRAQTQALQQYEQLMSWGYSQRQAAEEMNIPRTTLQDWLRSNPKKTPKILFLDIETAPTLFAGFGRFKQNFSQDHVVKEGGYILTAAWKFQGDVDVKATYSAGVSSGDDCDIVAHLYELIEQADVVVGQNVDDFDLGIIKSRLAKWNLPPLKHVKVVDTLKIARKMRFNANSLDALGAYLGVGRKVKHEGIDLWIRVVQGDKEALGAMLEYNVGDITLLESVYEKLKAFNQRAPGMQKFYPDDKKRCPACGSEDVESTGHVIHTQVSTFAEFKCNDCGHRSRDRENISTKTKRKNTLLSPRN